MYVPKIFLPPSSDAVEDFLSTHSFATVFSSYEKHMMASHTPLLYRREKESAFLYGHLSAANHQRHALENGAPVLCTFIQDHAYISSSWYKDVNVPTWNYIAVHVSGACAVLDDVATDAFLHQLTQTYEASSKKPFKVNDMDPKDYNRQKKGIVSFSVHIKQVEASFN